MTGTVLRSNGTTKAVRSFLSKTHWKPCAVYYRGQLPRPTATRKSKVSGFNLVVSRASSLSLSAQIRSAMKFLIKEHKELRRLKRAGLKATLDFGVASRPEAVFPYYNFPAEFIQTLAKANIDLEVSYYGVEDR